MRFRYKKYSLMLAALLIFAAVILAVLQNAEITNLFQEDKILAETETDRIPPDRQSSSQMQNNPGDENDNKGVSIRERGKR